MTATTQTSVALNVWTSLGAGPLSLSAPLGGVVYVVSDTAPSARASGTAVSRDAETIVATDSQIWVTSTLSQGAMVLSSPVNTVGNASVAIADTGVKTASFVGAQQTNRGARGVMVILTVSAVSGTNPTLAPQLRAGDGLGNFANLPGATQTITAAGTYLLAAYPGATSETGVASLPVPEIWDINWTIAGSSPSFTIASVVASYVE